MGLRWESEKGQNPVGLPLPYLLFLILGPAGIAEAAAATASAAATGSPFFLSPNGQDGGQKSPAHQGQNEIVNGIHPHFLTFRRPCR